MKLRSTLIFIGPLLYYCYHLKEIWVDFFPLLLFKLFSYMAICNLPPTFKLSTYLINFSYKAMLCNCSSKRNYEFGNQLGLYMLMFYVNTGGFIEGSLTLKSSCHYNIRVSMTSLDSSCIKNHEGFVRYQKRIYLDCGRESSFGRKVKDIVVIDI